MTTVDTASRIHMPSLDSIVTIGVCAIAAAFVTKLFFYGFDFASVAALVADVVAVGTCFTVLHLFDRLGNLENRTFLSCALAMVVTTTVSLFTFAQWPASLTPTNPDVWVTRTSSTLTRTVVFAVPFIGSVERVPVAYDIGYMPDGMSGVRASGMEIPLHVSEAPHAELKTIIVATGFALDRRDPAKLERFLTGLVGADESARNIIYDNLAETVYAAVASHQHPHSLGDLEIVGGGYSERNAAAERIIRSKLSDIGLRWQEGTLQVFNADLRFNSP